MDRWVGKVAVVTGASAGIGASIAEELVKHGLIVVGLARRVERIEALKSGLSGAKGKLHAVKCDVAKEQDIIAAFKWVKENLGKVHVLVNNAGIGRFGGLVEKGETKFWREILDVNVLGLSICTKLAYQLMKETGVDDGHIIHISSIAGHQVIDFNDPNMNMYAASKHAVKALTETLRQELRFYKSNIKITSISPGFVETEIMHATRAASNMSMDEETSSRVAQLPSLKAKDIADSVLYVLSTPPHVQVHDLIIKPVGEPF